MKLMMKKIFKQNINKIIIIAVWLLIWQAAASLTGLELILAGPVNVFKALCTKLGEKDFYIAAGGSFVHIFAGFIIAFVTCRHLGVLRTVKSVYKLKVNTGASSTTSFYVKIMLLISNRLFKRFVL